MFDLSSFKIDSSMHWNVVMKIVYLRIVSAEYGGIVSVGKQELNGK